MKLHFNMIILMIALLAVAGPNVSAASMKSDCMTVPSAGTQLAITSLGTNSGLLAELIS